MNNKILIGMLHLGSFPGHPGFVSKEKIIEDALKDIHTLETAGFDAIMIENRNDSSPTEFLSQRDFIFFDEILEIIRPAISIKCGINVLPNDYRSALQLASKYNIHIVQLDVVVDQVITDHSYSSAENFAYSVDKYDFLDYIKKYGKDIIIYGGVQPKHYKITDGKDLTQSLIEITNRPIDTVVITGNVTGEQASIEDVKLAKKILAGTDKKICIGSGINHNNIKNYMQYADSAIIGTSIKDESFSYIIFDKAKSLVDLIK